MKVVTLLNEKGGVGKTTAAVTIAAGLAIAGYRVLMVDADPQGNATTILGMNPYPGVYDCFYRGANWADVVRPIERDRVYHSDFSGGLFIVGGNSETRHLSSENENLEVIINRMLELEEANAFDFVVWDTSPTPSPLHVSIMLGTDFTMYPTRLEPLSLAGLKKSFGYLKQSNKIRSAWGYEDIIPIGIVPLGAELSTNEHNANWKTLVNTYGSKMVHPPIPKRIRWVEATAARRSIYAIEEEGSQTSQEAWSMVQGVLNYAQT